MLTHGLEAVVDRARGVRHDIHKHPELGFEEHRTQKVVMEWLKAYGYAPQELAETGVVADLRPERGKTSRTVALRADLDALPIREKTPLPYRSVHDGVSHKCGHDGHTAILLATAAQLATHRHEVDGNVRLIFQPAEEGVRGGGAKVMVAEGVLDGVDEIYGLHNWPPFPKGEIRVKEGATMAEVTSIDVRVEGKGGHASQPHATRDTIVAACQLVGAAQTIVARNLSTHEPAVLSFGTFHAGTVRNVIPQRAELTGTLRTFDPETTKKVVARLQSLAHHVGESMGVKIEVEIVPHYPALSSHARCVRAVERVARRLVGEAAVSDRELPITGGEDFAFYTQKIPGAYFLVGAGRPGFETPGCHHPDFDFDDDLIDTGARMFLGLVQDRLEAS
ncbi:MAG: M20 family metallopeptidase [Myxococcota bacterium]